MKIATSFLPLVTLLSSSWAHAEAPRPGDADFPAPSPSARHSAKVAAVKSGDYDLVLIGDSIIHTVGELTKELADGRQVFWLDVNHVFLRPDGTINTDLMWDLLHPSPAGAEAWAQAVEPTLAKLIGDKPLAPQPRKLALWPDHKAPIGDGRLEDANAFITVYRPAEPDPNGAAAVICPGGGYGGLVMGAEGSGIAKWLNGHGITGIVLRYRLPRGRRFVPLLDAQHAIRTARFNAKQWGCDPRRIGIIGFSAGGHLASTAATHFDGGKAGAGDPIERIGCRPDFAVLVYPVITMGDKTHGGSKRNLLGAAPSPETIDLFSNEKQVTAQSSPTFLAHALDDRAVPCDNSRMFHEALKANEVDTQYLELPSGGHGLNGYKGPMWEAWQRDSLKWLGSLKMIQAQKDAK